MGADSASPGLGVLHGPQDVQQARLRDAVGRLQVLLLRDLVGQFEADERSIDVPSVHRGWVVEDVLIGRSLGVYGPSATVSPSERALVVGVLEDLRHQRFVDRLDLDATRRRAWRLRRQSAEIVDAATRFVDEHRWVPPSVDLDGVIQAAAAIGESESPRQLPEPQPDARPEC
ncbi:MAG: hypothetical protein ACRDIY_11285 [Chloroflexota bacterium]